MFTARPKITHWTLLQGIYTQILLEASIPLVKDNLFDVWIEEKLTGAILWTWQITKYGLGIISCLLKVSYKDALCLALLICVWCKILWFRDDTSKGRMLSVLMGGRGLWGEVDGVGGGLEIGEKRLYQRWNWSWAPAAIHLSCTYTCGIWLPVWSSKEFYNDTAA